MVIINIYLISTFNKYPQIRNGIGFCHSRNLMLLKCRILRVKQKLLFYFNYISCFTIIS